MRNVMCLGSFSIEPKLGVWNECSWTTFDVPSVSGRLLGDLGRPRVVARQGQPTTMQRSAHMRRYEWMRGQIWARMGRGKVGPAAQLAWLGPRGPSQGSSRGSPGGPPGDPPGGSPLGIPGGIPSEKRNFLSFLLMNRP